MRLGVILYATDFSPEAATAFSAACSLAKETAARLILAHVHERPFGASDELPARDDGIHHDLEALAERARGLGIARVDTRLVHGHAWHRIVDLAREEGCSLIVLGMRGHSSERHMPIGRVAEEVTRNASCSVLVVRPQARDAAAA